jgi:hypothetical protein
VQSTRLYRFVRRQFQFLFHWASRPSFHLSLTVLVHYRFQTIFSLGGWFPRIPTVYVHRGTQDTHRAFIGFAYKTFTFYGLLFQAVLLPQKVPHLSPTTPSQSRRIGSVWAFTFSLAATKAITLFSFPHLT